MKKLLKRIWYRIVYKQIEQKKMFCRGCAFELKQYLFCKDINESYGKACNEDIELIYVKRFKLSL